MTEKLDAYDIWDIVSSLSIREQEPKLAELCAGDDELLNNVRGLIGVYSSNDAVQDVFSNSLIDLTKNNFDPSVLVGASANNYTLHEFHAQGALGYIFKGVRKDTHLIEQQVAIKVIQPHLVDKYTYDLIDREANIMANLSTKSNIAKVFDAGVVTFNQVKLPCYMMDFIGGKGVVEHFKGDYLGFRERIECFIKILDALHFAHTQDTPIIHADVKPDNILIDAHGEPQLLDFGVAQHVREQQGETRLLVRNYAKQFSTDYSSPELLNAEPLGVTSDVYSVGRMMWEVFSGQFPLISVSDTLIAERCERFYDYKTYRRWVPELADIFKKSLCEEPEDRFDSALQMKEALKSWLNCDKTQHIERSRAFGLYKFSMLYPVHTLLAAFSAVAGTFIFIFAFWFSSWFPQAKLDMNLSASLSLDLYKSELVIDTFVDERVDNGIKALLRSDIAKIKRNKFASDELRLKLFMEIADVAMNRLYWAIAEKALSGAYEINKGADLVMLGNLAKALSILGEKGKAETITNQIFNKISADGVNDIDTAKLYLSLLDGKTRYIINYFPEEVTTLSLLDEIEVKYYDELDVLNKATLRKLQAEEYFYGNYGDPISPSIGSDTAFYLTEIKPNLIKSKRYIDMAIKLLDSREYNKYLPEFLARSARVEYELKNNEHALALAEQALTVGAKHWGLNSEVVHNVRRSNYGVFRFLDLSAAKANHEKNFTEYRPDDFYVADDYLLDLSLMLYASLYAGDHKGAFEALNYMRSAYDSSENIGFIGLDSYYAGLINMMEFISFAHIKVESYSHFNTRDSEIENELDKVTRRLLREHPEKMGEYESTMVDLYVSYYQNDKDEALILIGDLIETRSKSKRNEADLNFRIMLNSAIIASKFSEYEYAKVLVNLAEESMSWSPLEEVYSPAYMLSYLQMAEIYKSMGDISAYYSAKEKAEVVFNTHFETLKGSAIKEEFFNSNVVKTL